MGVPELNPLIDALGAGFAANDPGVSGKALEHANVRAVMRLFENLGRGDLDAFVGGLSDAVELAIHAPAAFSWIRRARGREKLRAVVEHKRIREIGAPAEGQL